MGEKTNDRDNCEYDKKNKQDSERKKRKTEKKTKIKDKLKTSKGQKGAQGTKRKGVSRGAEMSENETEENDA